MVEWPTLWDLVALTGTAVALWLTVPRAYHRWKLNRPARIEAWAKACVDDLIADSRAAAEKIARRRAERRKRIVHAGATPELASAIVDPLPDEAAPAAPSARREPQP